MKIVLISVVSGADIEEGGYDWQMPILSNYKCYVSLLCKTKNDISKKSVPMSSTKLINSLP